MEIQNEAVLTELVAALDAENIEFDSRKTRRSPRIGYKLEDAEKVDFLLTGLVFNEKPLIGQLNYCTLSERATNILRSNLEESGTHSIKSTVTIGETYYCINWKKYYYSHGEIPTPLITKSSDYEVDQGMIYNKSFKQPKADGTPSGAP